MNSDLLFASDLDGTLIPLDAHEAYTEEVLHLHRVRKDTPHFKLAYVTGRSFSLANAGIAEFSLPEPDWLICDVGTSLYGREGDRWGEDETYCKFLEQMWGGDESNELQDLSAEVSGLSLQAAEQQKRFKCSFFVELTNKRVVLEAVRASVEKKNIPVQIIFSIDPLTNVGLLDILPPKASKRSAVFHLAQQLGLSSASIIYAGDSGNDLEMFTSGCRAILVANTPLDVVTEVERWAAESTLEQQIFCASRKYSAGVLEGLRHFTSLF